MSARPPQRIGRYELLCELGRGGMAELHLARLHGVGGFEKLVALKLILPHLATDRGFVEQFLNEGRIAARLSHPNVCQVYELGEGEGRLYLAMEYLEGVSWEQLATVVPGDPVQVLRFAVGLLAQACDGLAHAHTLRDARGQPTPVVHRDVSPSNLFVTIDGVCKLLDFGVSKILGEGKHTRTGVLKGKLPYMSPEQIEGTPVDQRADVFAAGVVMWEALAGERLFDRSTDFQIWKAITEEEVPLLGTLKPYGGDVDAVVQRALARSPDARYQTIRAFADDLRAVARTYGGAVTNDEIAGVVRERCGAQLSARTRLVTRATTAPRAPVAAPPDEPIRAAVDDDPAATASLALRAESIVLDRRRGRWWPFLGGVLVVAVVVGGFMIGQSGGDDDRGASADPARTVAVAPAPAVASVDASVVADAEPVAFVDAHPPSHRRSTTHASLDRPHKKEVRVVEASPAPTAPPVTAPVAEVPGLFTIDSKPYARIYIDGKYVDQTPIYRHRIAPGAHTIRAVLADGRDKTFNVRILPGKEFHSGMLAW